MTLTHGSPVKKATNCHSVLAVALIGDSQRAGFPTGTVPGAVSTVSVGVPI